jgi:hypothetical protein
MNKLHPQSKVPEAITRRLLRAYAYDLSVSEAAKRTGLSQRQVVEIFGRIRRRVSDHIDELVGHYINSPEWEEALAGVYETANMSLLFWKSGLLTVKGMGLITFQSLKSPQIEAALELRKLATEEPETYAKMVWEQVYKHLDDTARMYDRHRVVKKRGILKKDAAAFFKESCYRYMVSMTINRNRQITDSQREVASSTGAVTFNVGEKIHHRVFDWDKYTHRQVFKDLVNLVLKYPL